MEAKIGSKKVLLDFRRLYYAISTIDADMKTRDFTVNAIYYDPLTQEIIDKCGGINHIAAKELHVVTNLNTTFKDETRLLRALRFWA